MFMVDLHKGIGVQVAMPQFGMIGDWFTKNLEPMHCAGGLKWIDI